MLKEFLDSAAGRALQGRLIGWYVRFCGATTRWTYIGREIVEAAWAKGGPVVLCFWHNRLLLVRRGWEPWNAPQKLGIMISQSRDGDIISEACRTVGFQAIRGSSSKGASAAFREMLTHTKDGGAVGFTPDGPRGPRGRVQLGAVRLAARTGAPIVCFAWSKANTIISKKSWDRHLFPRPFGRGVFIWGGPITVAKNADDAELERVRLALENLLQQITDEADRRAGLPLIPPDAAADAANADAEPASA